LSPSPDCPVCGLGSTEKRFVFHAYTVARCTRCTVEFLRPQPDDATLARIYTENYFFDHDGSVDHAQHVALKQASALRTLQPLGAPKPGAKLLDIGAGTGDFLIVAARLGYDVVGVEYSASSVEEARKRVPGELFAGEVADAHFPDASFDVVATTDVIEHTRDPQAFVREIRRILKPGGYAIITTPATDSWSARLMGTRWMEYKVEHLFYFNVRSLHDSLTQAGFNNIVIRPNVKILSLAYIGVHFERFPVPGWSRVVAAAMSLVPAKWRERPFPIVASGITAVAKG
jgi:2-polyprenyl-3-methyl-5-hydroxy-6-metoxy-1,4-benzoquinol methylase